MDSNVKIFQDGWSYQFHDKMACAKTGIRARNQGFNVRYFYNEWNSPCFKVYKKREKK